MVIQRLLLWLRSNLTSMLIALLLSLTVWVIAAQQQNPTVEFELAEPVPIDVVGLSDGLTITNDYPRTAIVRLRAQQSNVSAISAEDIVLTADLTDLGPGTFPVQVRSQVATQAILVSIAPSNIRVSIERESQREMPVQLAIVGELPTGYTFENEAVQRNPARVSITGPESRVKLVSEVTASISIDGQREPVIAALPLQALDAEGSIVTGVEITPSTVDINIPVYQEAGFRELAIRVPTVGRPASGYYMTSRVVTPPLVTVQGDPALIESLPPLINTQAVDLTGLTDDLIIEVGLDLPAGVSIVGSPTVEVLITIAAQQDSRSLVVQAAPVGLDAGLRAVIEPAEIEVFISGPLPVLQALDPSKDIIVNVELFGLGPGTYQVEPTVQVINSAVSVDSVLPVVLQVRITSENG